MVIAEAARRGVDGLLLLGALGCGSSPQPSSGPDQGRETGGAATAGASQTGGRDSSAVGGGGDSSRSGNGTGGSLPAAASGTGGGASVPSGTCGSNEALCNGRCFATLGEEHDGCRLLVQPAMAPGGYNGAYLPAVVDGKLYFLTYGELEVVDLASLERRSVYSSSMVVHYGVADTFAIVSAPNALLRVELADGKVTTLGSGMAGSGFTLRGATWYFSSSFELFTMPREGGAPSGTGITAGTFAIVEDDVYSETGFSLSAEVQHTSLSNPASSQALAMFEDGATVLHANEGAAYWLGDGRYHAYSVADQTITSMDLGARGVSFATRDGLVLAQRDEQARLLEVSASDLKLSEERFLATISPGPQAEIVTATATHVYLCTDHGGIFEVAR